MIKTRLILPLLLLVSVTLNSTQSFASSSIDVYIAIDERQAPMVKFVSADHRGKTSNVAAIGALFGGALGGFIGGSILEAEIEKENLRLTEAFAPDLW